MKINKIYCADNLKLIKDVPDNCIDMIATDPPYGLKFMGKDWDKALPPPEIFQEMNRVLKPGAFCFVFSSPRQDLLWRMMQRLENAGFMIDLPSIYWTYATGIGLAQNVSKMIDKRMGAEGEVIRKYTEPSGLNKKRVKHGYRKTVTPGGKITAPASDLAKEFDGAYIRYRPKPALEVILVAMKPIEEKTYIEQVMKNGKACTWLDLCRIPINKNDNNIRQNAINHLTNKPAALDAFLRKKEKTYDRKEFLQDMGFHSSQGRYPTNLLVQDDLLDTGENHKSNEVKPHHKASDAKTNKVYGNFKENPLLPKSGDTGSYSRFFCFDSWARECLPKTYPFLPVTKPTAGQKAGREAHLTEKPPQIFAYLITLASRPGDIVADFFGGSGSCALAAAALNRDWIYCDIEEKHCDIARQRLSRLTAQREEMEL